MNKVILSIASGAVLCCAAVAYFASPLAGTDPSLVVAWTAVLFCHVLAGFYAIGGAATVAARSRAGILVYAGLAALWTILQALAAVLLIAALSLAIPAETARIVLVSATVLMAILSVLAMRSRSSGKNGTVD